MSQKHHLTTSSNAMIYALFFNQRVHQKPWLVFFHGSSTGNDIHEWLEECKDRRWNSVPWPYLICWCVWYTHTKVNFADLSFNVGINLCEGWISRGELSLMQNWTIAHYCQEISHSTNIYRTNNREVTMKQTVDNLPSRPTDFLNGLTATPEQCGKNVLHRFVVNLGKI